MFFSLLVFAVMQAKMTLAVGSCNYNGKSGTCESSCPGGQLIKYGTPGVDAGCKPYAKHIKCCVLNEVAIPQPRPQDPQPDGPQNPQNPNKPAEEECSWIMWIRGQCEDEGDPAPQNPQNPNPQNPANPQIPDPEPQLPVNPGQVGCSVSRNGMTKQGFCSSTCTRGGFKHYSWGEDGVDMGCRQQANPIKCCAPVFATLAQPDPVQPSGGSLGACKSPFDSSKAGECREESTCPNTLQAYPSSEYSNKADSCKRFPSSSVKCCAAKPPPGQAIPNSGPTTPQGSCQLARGDSTCSSVFGGKTLTINAYFIDEVQRVAAHARAAGVTLHVTSSFRPAGTKVGAARSRHKVGMAFDMNASGCNAACMCRLPTRNSKVTNFLRRLVRDTQIRWGADPKEPINWPVGGCSKDSVHIEAKRYEVQPRYDAEQTCLNREYRAGRFRRFSCSGAARLVDDVDLSNLDEINSPPEGLSVGAIVGIVIGSIIVCALCAVCILVVVLRSGEDKADVRVDNPFYAEAPVPQTYVAAGSASAYPTSEGYATASYGGYMGGTGTQFACNQCNKAYSNVEDLQTHVSLRH